MSTSHNHIEEREVDGQTDQALPYPADLCVPDHYPGAVRFLEAHARITKLPAGNWRVWLRKAGIRVYGTTRWSALREAACRVRGRTFNDLLGS